MFLYSDPRSACFYARPQLELIAELQSAEWWQDVTAAMLEQVRKKLRALVPFIEKLKRKVLFADFQDEIGEEVEIDLLGVVPRESMERFRAKVQAFLRKHEDHIAIHRLRMNKGTTLNANQIHFIDLIISHLTQRGVMPAELLYESPFADVSPQGPEGLFTETQVGELVLILEQVRTSALAS